MYGKSLRQGKGNCVRHQVRIGITSGLTSGESPQVRLQVRKVFKSGIESENGIESGPEVRDSNPN